MRKLILILAASAAFAQESPCVQNFMYAGVGINNGGSRAISGVAAYGKRLACLSGHGVYSISGVNVTGGFYTPAYTFSTGAGIEIFKRDYVTILVAGDLGVAQQIIATGNAPLDLASITSMARSGGGMFAWRKFPAFMHIPVGVALSGAGRVQSGAAGPTVTVGWSYGWGN